MRVGEDWLRMGDSCRGIYITSELRWNVLRYVSVFFWREGISAACIMWLKRISIFGYRRHSLTRAADSVAAIKVVVTSFRCHSFIGTVYVLGVIVSAFSCKWNASTSTFHFEVKERPVENIWKCDTVGRIYSKIFFCVRVFHSPVMRPREHVKEWCEVLHAQSATFSACVTFDFGASPVRENYRENAPVSATGAT